MRSFLLVCGTPWSSSGIKSNLPLWPITFSCTLPEVNRPSRHTVFAVALHACSWTKPPEHTVHAAHEDADSR